MLAVIELGSKFKKYFIYGVSNPAKMKYVLENLSDKFMIKKYGSLFLMTQEQLNTIIVGGQILVVRILNLLKCGKLLKKMKVIII